MIRAVTFDLDGVYFTEDSFKKFKSIFRQYSPGQALIDHVLAAQTLGINAFVYQGFDHFIDKLGLGLLQSVV